MPVGTLSHSVVFGLSIFCLLIAAAFGWNATSPNKTVQSRRKNWYLMLLSIFVGMAPAVIFRYFKW